MQALFILVIPVVLMLQTAACYGMHRSIGPDVLKTTLHANLTRQ